MSKVLAVTAVLLLVSLPASAGRGELGVGIGYSNSPTDFNTTSDNADMIGGTVLGAFGFAEHWEVLLSFRAMEESDLLIFEGYQADQFAAHAVYTWRPSRLARPRIKLGLASTGAEYTSYFGDKETDRGESISGGGGIEIGRKYSGFLDVDRTTVQLFDDDVDFTNVTVGLVVRFRRGRS